MQLSLAEARRRLTVGSKVRVTFLRGPIKVVGNTGNTEIAPPVPTLRNIVSQSAHQMVSQNLDGPKVGEKVFCTWKGVKADVAEDGSITLSMDVPFARFEFVDD